MRAAATVDARASNSSGPILPRPGRSSRWALRSSAISATACSCSAGSRDVEEAAAPRSMRRWRTSSTFGVAGSGVPGCTLIVPRRCELPESPSRRHTREFSEGPAGPGVTGQRSKLASACRPRRGGLLDFGARPARGTSDASSSCISCLSLARPRRATFRYLSGDHPWSVQAGYKLRAAPEPRIPRQAL